MRTPALVASSAVGLACGLNITNVGAIAEQVASGYRIGLAEVGLFTMALVVTHTLVQIPGGRLADRYGALRLASGSMALIIVCNGLLMIAPVPALGLSLRAVVGLGTGAGFVAGSAYLSASGKHALAQGFYGGVGIFASGVSLAAVPQVESLVGWRAPYLTALVAAAVALVVVATAEPGPSVAARRRTEGHALGSLLRDRRLLRLAAMHGTAQSSIVIGAWISTLFVRALGMSKGTAGLVGALALMGGLVTRPGSGWLLYRKPDRVRAALACSLLAGAAGILLIATARWTPVAVLGALLLGLAAGVPFAPAFFGAARLRPDAPAAAVGFVNAVGHGPIILGTPLLGLAFSLPGDGRIGFAIVAALWLIALVALPKASDFEGATGLETADRAR